MKQIVSVTNVRNCVECPHRSYHHIGSDEGLLTVTGMTCDCFDDREVNQFAIPDWCPLPDAEEPQK